MTTIPTPPPTPPPSPPTNDAATGKRGPLKSARGSYERVRTGYRSLLVFFRESLLWTLLANQRTWLRWMAAILVVNFTLNLQIANMVARMVDEGIIAQAVPLRGFLAWIIGLATVQLVTGFTFRQLVARLGYHVEFDLRTWLYTRIQAAELRRLDAVTSGQLVTRALTDLSLVESMLRLIPTVGAFVPVLLGLTVFVALQSPVMAVLAVLAIPLNLWLLSRFRTRLWALSYQELNERAEVTTAIDEPVRGIRVVQAFGREDHERGRVADVALRTYRFAMTRVRLLARYDILLKLVPVAVQASVLLVGARLVVGHRLSLGSFLVSFQLVGFITAFSQLFDELASVWQYLRTAQSRIGEMLALGRRPSTTGDPLPPVSTGLELRNVTVELGGRRVLDALDLQVRPGELVVVTGAPGSGKTTVAGVAAGMLGVDEGEVVLDGAEIGEVDPGDLVRAIRVVSEEPFLFATSVRENLELAVPRGNVDEDTLRAAMWAAGADDMLDDLAEGLDTHIGDRGLTLSGGQRQRLALARALVVPPRVLVLDDAVSAVNPALEIEIIRRIRAHAPETAILCISRRTGVEAVADRIVPLPAPMDAATVTAPEAAGGPRGGMRGLHDAMRDITSTISVSPESPAVDERVAADDSPPRLRGVLRPFSWLIVVGVTALLLQTFLTRIAPDLLFGDVADIVGDDDVGSTDKYGFALLGLGLVGAGSAYVFRIFAQRFSQGLVYLLRRRVFRRLSRLGIDYYDREMPGEVAARVVHDLDVIANFLQGPAFSFVAFSAQLVMGMTVLLLLSPSVAVIVAVLGGAIAAITMAQLPISMRAFGWARRELGRVTSILEEDFTARRDIRGFGAGARLTRRFTIACWELRRARRWAATVGNAYSELMQLLAQVAAAVVLYQSGNLVLAGTLSVGTAVTLRLMAQNATQPLPQIAPFYVQFLDVRVSWRRLKEPFEQPILPTVHPDAVACEHLAGEIAFDHVAFSYPHTGRRILHDVTFRVPAGTVAALVGYPGAGKSSIAKLLTRVYDPDEGVVSVDGQDLRHLDLRSFRSRLGVVPQDAFLFRGTVASNIAYGNPTAAQEQIVAAARAVGAHDTLDALEGGYDHEVDEEGRNLTAAQRQLIALARAWLSGPDVLVLDEATSSLDAALEGTVLDAVAGLGCTTLMITHRQAVVARSELVIVMEGGRVVEQGPRQEVVGQGGACDRLWVSSDVADERAARPARQRRTRRAGTGARR